MRFTALLLLAVALLFSVPALASPAVGSQRPAIKLVDGWDRELDLASVKRPLLLIYAGKNTSTQNQVLTGELAALESSIHYRRAVLEVGVADVAAYDQWPARGIVKDELKKHSMLGVVVYADFTGQVGTKLALTPGQSNVVLYGSDGKVLFSYAGAVPEVQRRALVDLIRALVARLS